MATPENPLIYTPEPAQTIHDVAAVLRFLVRHPLEPDDRAALGSILQCCASALTFEAERIAVVNIRKPRGQQHG